jgi:hypothetical protein
MATAATDVLSCPHSSSLFTVGPLETFPSPQLPERANTGLQELRRGGLELRVEEERMNECRRTNHPRAPGPGRRVEPLTTGDGEGSYSLAERPLGAGRHGGPGQPVSDDGNGSGRRRSFSRIQFPRAGERSALEKGGDSSKGATAWSNATRCWPSRVLRCCQIRSTEYIHPSRHINHIASHRWSSQHSCRLRHAGGSLLDARGSRIPLARSAL